MIPKAERNALWLLFSTDPEKVGYGAGHYRQSGEMSTLINDLFKKYHTEGIAMPYTIEDYRKDYVREHMHKLPLAERIRGVAPDELFREFPPEERLRGLPPEERLRGLSLEERLRGLSEEERRKAAEIIMKQEQKSSGN